MARERSSSGGARVAWWRTPFGKRVAWVSAVLALLVGGLLMWQPWSGNARPLAAEGEFASDRDSARPVDFDAKRAMGYLEDLCKIGPRISGSAGMKKQQELLEKHFKAHGGKVAFQRFRATQRSERKPVEMANLIVSYHPEKSRRVILCSHYDTRPLADQEPDRRRWREDFLSANDGGSGVALLMELARHMKDLKTSVGVDFVLFDGEEYIHDPERDKYFFGSEHFGREYAKARGKRKFTYTGAVLLDMIAGKGAKFPVEQHSWWKASRLVKEVWGIARELKCGSFEDGFSRDAVLDDHVALNAAGIPAIDVIDFSYPHWHRLSDVPKNCSGESMAQVAKVLSVWVQRAK